MRLKLELVFVFAFALLIALSSNLILCSHSDLAPVKEGGFPFIFWVAFGDVDWTTRSINTQIKARIESLPYNYSHIEVEAANVFYRVENNQTTQVDGGQAKFRLFQSGGGGNTFIYDGNVSASFRLFGITDFYPYDVYMVNLTFSLPHFGLINENNTYVNVDFEEAGLLGQSRRPQLFDSIVLDGEFVKLNVKFGLDRGYYEPMQFGLIIIICFSLLGSMPLIKPEKLEQRLTICLTLFIFSISFASSIQFPAKPLLWMPFTKALVGTLLAGTGFLAIASVIEKALIDVNPRLGVCQYILEGLFLLLIGGSLTPATTQFSAYLQVIRVYPWQATYSLLGIVSGMYAPFVLYGYVSKTFVFVTRPLWNRAQMGKRIKAIRLFHRKAKSS
jgi:hypothetical protein